MTQEQEEKLLELTSQDTIYQEYLKELEHMEELFAKLRGRLSPYDQEILDRYIALCEELEYRRTCLATELTTA